MFFSVGYIVVFGFGLLNIQKNRSLQEKAQSFGCKPR